MRITYLYHSGFAVETKEHFLVFDYWKHRPKNGLLTDGIINPEEQKDKDVIVFASHRHPDHFNKVILGWPESISKCRIILSDDIESGENVLKVGANAALKEADFELHTFLSNDEGVAFLVEIDGKRIYHAGDLNWWHWEGEPGSWNSDVKISYQKEMELLSAYSVDLAFVPVDPRLGDQYAWGIDHLMRTVDVRHVVPMHFGKASDVIERLLDDPVSESYRHKIIPFKERGQSEDVE
ncbi:MAG: MBL fold metallo-hydrolase [Oscillospiraceae bacterium]|nr:MBL fold metallo-hydrolase [Oscillospiraceae bacterium]